MLADEWSDEKRKEFTIRDNVSYGEWDFDTLANEWDVEELTEWGLDIPDDFIEEEITEAKEDNFEIPDEIQTDIVLGDLFEIGEHRLLCGDSTDSDSVAKLMNGEKADMVLTDPPYNVDYSGANGEKIQNDKMSSGDFYQFLFEFYKNATANIKNGGVWYVWHTDNENINFRKAFEENNNKFSECLIWVKNTFALGHLDYHKKHETCLYGWKEGAGHYFTPDRTNTTVIDDKIELKKLSKADMLKMLQEIYSDKTKTTILYCDKPYRNAEHPTMKPILLIAPLIENSSKKGWIVLDSFLGSGSTMVAAHQLNRKCYGMELDPKYCQVIVDRMRKLDPTIEIKKNGIPY
jgi:DNA modification methylase